MIMKGEKIENYRSQPRTAHTNDAILLNSKFITINEHRRRNFFHCFLLACYRRHACSIVWLTKCVTTTTHFRDYFYIFPCRLSRSTKYICAIFTSIYNLRMHQFLTWLFVLRTLSVRTRIFQIYFIVHNYARASFTSKAS